MPGSSPAIAKGIGVGIYHPFASPSPKPLSLPAL
jgi:hypothetical protein